jgi:hypothetical protein
MSRQASRIIHIPRRITLALLMLPTLAALALLACATLWHQPRQVHTGDALLDTYLQTVFGYGRLTNKWWMLLRSAEALPPGQWEQWEQQFGSDPRFWMLCHSFRPHAAAAQSQDLEAEHAEHNRFLNEALSRGVADWKVLLTLTLENYSHWEFAAESQVALAHPVWNTALSERIAYHRQLTAAIDRLFVPQRQQLLDQLRRAATDQAVAHYQLATMLDQSGDPAGAYAAVAAGNAAPENEAGDSCPFDTVSKATASGQPLAGDIYLTGLLAGHSYTGDVNRNDFRAMITDLADWAVQAADLASLQALHRACCRVGQSTGVAFYDSVSAVLEDKYVLDAIQRLTPSTASARIQLLNTAQTQLKQLDTAINALRPNMLILYGNLSAWDSVLESTPAISYGGKYLTLDRLQSSGRDEIARQTALSGPVRQQFEALAALDFTK